MIEDMRGHRAVGQPSKVEMGSWRARMNLRIRMKGRAMLVGKIARHVIIEVGMKRCIPPAAVKLKGLKVC